MISQKTIWKWATVLSIIGILLATYLFYNFLTKPAFQPCYINSQINCDAVTKGSLAIMFGVPVSLIGLVGYIVILLSSLFKNKNLLLLMSTFGLIFCLYITYQEVFIVKVICPVCLACQLVMLAIFLLGLKLTFGFRKSA